MLRYVYNLLRLRGILDYQRQNPVDHTSPLVVYRGENTTETQTTHLEGICLSLRDVLQLVTLIKMTSHRCDANNRKGVESISEER
jgi:hypothetical protein